MVGARRSSYRVTFAVLTASIGSYALLQAMVVPVLSTLQHVLHTSQGAATWVLTAYLLSAAVMTPILGRLGDIYGKERILVVTLAALAAGSVLAALAPNIGVMIIARVIQGLAGGMMPVGFGIIRDEFPADRVAGAVGLLAALLGIGSGLGIVLAGPIVNALGWRWLFWLPLMVAVLAGICAVLFIPESPVRSRVSISWLSAALLTGWLVALLVPLSEAPTWGWGSPAVLGLFALAAVLAAAWVWAELHSATPLIDMTMMRRPAVWTNNMVALLLGMAQYATFAFLPEFVQTPTSAGYGFGASITRSGLMLLPSTLTMFVAGLFVGRLTRRLGGKTLVWGGCCCGSTGLLILAFAHSEQWELYLASAVLGAGFGMAYAAMSALVVSAVPPEQTGVASGMNANIRNIGGSIGAAVMATIVTSQLEPSGLPKESGYTTGFAVMAAAGLLAVLAGLLIPVQRRSAAAGAGGAETVDADAAVAALTMSGDVLGSEAAAGETVAIELAIEPGE
jgi:EmrB/QacA subfamily drug resistance transporter